MKMRKFKKGFTLVELVVVIAVIAVLAAVSVGAYFGVTESAKQSNATTALKQAKDYYMMYTVDKDTDTTLEGKHKGNDFAIRYVLNIGANLDIDFALVETNDNKSGIVYKVETEYPTWFLVVDNNIIEEGPVSKNETDFINSIDNSTIITTPKEDLKFLISTIKLSDGTITRGYRYQEVTVTNVDGIEVSTETAYVLDGTSLASTDDRYVIKNLNGGSATSGGVTGDVLRGPDSQYLLDNQTWDSTTNIDLEEKMDAIYSLDNEGYQYSYVVDTFEVERNFYQYDDLNWDNYPIIVRTTKDGVSTDYYRKNFAEVTTVLENVGQPDSGKIGYIFTQNAVVESNFNVPAGYILVVDYVENINDAGSFTTTYKKMEDLSTWKDNGRTGNTANTGISTENLNFNRETKEITYNEPKVSDSLNSLEVANNVILTIENGSALAVEGYIDIPGGSKSLTIRDHATINNKGSIVAKNGSFIRSTGKILDGTIEGEGEEEKSTLTLENGSKMYDVLKPLNFIGGTSLTQDYLGFENITKNILNATYTIENGLSVGIFPLQEYIIDNVQVKTIVETGCSYILLSGLNISNTDFYVTINLFGTSENSLLRMQNNSKVIKYTDGYTTNLSLVEGNCDFGYVSFRVKYGGIMELEINSSNFNFPVSNINFCVNESAILNASKIGDRPLDIQFTPTSTLTNNGTINLNNGAQLSILDFDDNTYSLIKNNYVVNSLMRAETASYFEFRQVHYNNKNIEGFHSFENNGSINIVGNTEYLDFITNNIGWTGITTTETKIKSYSSLNVFSGAVYGTGNIIDNNKNINISDYKYKLPITTNKVTANGVKLGKIELVDVTDRQYAFIEISRYSA